MNLFQILLIQSIILTHWFVQIDMHSIYAITLLVIHFINLFLLDYHYLFILMICFCFIGVRVIRCSFPIVVNQCNTFS